MKYVSLFSGIGGFEYGIQDVFPDAECIAYSEIDKFAIRTYLKNFPKHIGLGCIEELCTYFLPKIDLIVGGFPCQDLSVAKNNRKGLDGESSGLFWDMLRIHNDIKPKFFCYENVASMRKSDKAIITKALKVEPVMIDAGKVSAQNRKRLYWCNFPVSQPEERGYVIADIIELGVGTEYNIIPKNTIRRNTEKWQWNMTGKKHYSQQDRAAHILSKSYPCTSSRGDDKCKTFYTEEEMFLVGKARGFNAGYVKDVTKHKSPTLTGSKWQDNNVLVVANVHKGISDDSGYTVRRVTPIEYERLQCFPDNWTEGVKKTQRYKQLGNAVNGEVVKHIMECLRSII